MLSVPGKKCFATIAQAKCVLALISDLLPLDWCHIHAAFCSNQGRI